MSDPVTRLLSPRFAGGGSGATLTALVRIVAGLLFVTFSLGKFTDHAQEAVDFDRYGIPVPSIATYVVGSLELVCGFLLVVGLFTRPAAVLLGANMLGAIATAGRVDGGTFHLGVAPTLLAVMVFLAWAGCGRWAVDGQLLATRRSEHERARGREPSAL